MEGLDTRTRRKTGWRRAMFPEFSTRKVNRSTGHQLMPDVAQITVYDQPESIIETSPSAKPKRAAWFCDRIGAAKTHDQH
jgi:hypothetical protein